MASRKFPEIAPAADACVFAALALLVLPLNWLAAAVAAALIHECFHYAALMLCGAEVYGVAIISRGILLETEGLSPGKEAVCALAGPGGSLLLLLLWRLWPELALWGGVQGLYNLLPVYPMDGGRAVKGILTILCPRKARRISEWVSRATVLFIALLGFYGMIRLKLGFGAMVPALLLLGKALPRKTPCKDGHKRVQ